VQKNLLIACWKLHDKPLDRLIEGLFHFLRTLMRGAEKEKAHDPLSDHGPR